MSFTSSYVDVSRWASWQCAENVCHNGVYSVLTASPSAVPGIGRARFDEHTTPGGRTRMMMSARMGTSSSK